MKTMKSIALSAYLMADSGYFCLKNSLYWSLLALCAVLTACATPQAPSSKAVYDFGSALQAPSSAATARSAVIALPEIEAGAGLETPALLYRFQYANDQQLRPYAQARWSVPPAQLVRARLRDALSVQGPVLSTEGVAPWTLRVELDEFSQVFASPESSQGLLRLRASLFKGQQLAAQTTVLTQASAPTQDAPGGVRALTAATDDAVRQIAAWAAAQIKL